MCIGFILLILAVVSFFMLGCILTRHSEKKNYNNSICPKCGEKLRQFDIASDGSRGYTCNKCGYTTWCSYNVDK